MNRSLAACALLSLALAAAAPASQSGPLTLAGSLDVNLSGRGRSLDLNTLYDAETSFDGYHLRLDAQGEVAGGFRAVVQVRLSDAAEPRVVAAYLMYTPRPERDLHAIAGKMPWLVGTWGARAAPERQPLVGTPLMYQLPTRLPSDAIVPDADSLYRIEAASGGSSYGGGGEVHGMRVVEDGWWDVGLGLMGSARGLEFALGISNGTPGAPNPARDVNSGKTALGRVGLAPLPGVRVGVSGAYGAWLPEALDSQLPAGRGASDYHQRLVMADAELLGGHAELRGEAFLNAWETPTLGTLRARGGYAEGKLTLAAGCYAAARYDLLRFSKLHESTGEPFPWNDDVDRIEAGGGYRPSRGTLLKVVWQRTTLADGEETDREDLFAAQFVLVF
jgi:hypothetical protein